MVYLGGVRFERLPASASGSYAVTPPEPDELTLARASFDDRHMARLARVLDASILDEIRSQIDAASFSDRTDEGIARESTMNAPGVLARLLFLINDERFVETVRRATGVDDIVGFDGRVFRFSSAAGHYDSWHTDVDGVRRVAMSLNLSAGPIEGGELSIRRRGSSDEDRYAYPPPGDAIIFRIDPALEHRINPVLSRTPRTTLAGWFVTEAGLPSLPGTG